MKRAVPIPFLLTLHCFFLTAASFSADSSLPRPPDNCSSLFWLLGRNTGYRTTAQIPTIVRTDKPVQVLVYASWDGTGGGHNIPALLRAAHKRAKAKGAPGIMIRTVDVSAFKSNADLVKHIRTNSQWADVIFISGHANPVSIQMNGNVDIRAENFSGIDLSGKTVIATGCNTGACIWEEDMFASDSALRGRIGQRVAPDTSLVEGIMRNSNPDHVIGTTRTTENEGSRDDNRLINALFVEGGGVHLEGFRTVSLATDSRPHVGETVESLLKLRDGNTSQKIRYIEAVLAWRTYGYEADLDFIKTLRRWARDPEISEKLERRVFTVLLEYDINELRKMLPKIGGERRHRILRAWMGSFSLTQDVLDYREIFGMLARGNPELLRQLAEAIPSEIRQKIIDHYHPSSWFNWECPGYTDLIRELSRLEHREFRSW